MSNENSEQIELMTQILGEREASLSESQKIKTVELYNQLRLKVVKIYRNHFEANYWKREAEQSEKKTFELWKAFFWISAFLFLAFYLKLQDDAFMVAIGFVQLLVTTFFVTRIAKLYSMKAVASHSSELMLREASEIESELKFFGESYEYSDPILKFINEIKKDGSMPFHEHVDVLAILEIKVEIAKHVSWGY